MLLRGRSVYFSGLLLLLLLRINLLVVMVVVLLLPLTLLHPFAVGAARMA